MRPFNLTHRNFSIENNFVLIINFAKWIFDTKSLSARNLVSVCFGKLIECHIYIHIKLMEPLNLNRMCVRKVIIFNWCSNMCAHNIAYRHRNGFQCSFRHLNHANDKYWVDYGCPSHTVLIHPSSIIWLLCSQMVGFTWHSHSRNLTQTTPQENRDKIYFRFKIDILDNGFRLYPITQFGELWRLCGLVGLF